MLLVMLVCYLLSYSTVRHKQKTAELRKEEEKRKSVCEEESAQRVCVRKRVLTTERERKRLLAVIRCERRLNGRQPVGEFEALVEDVVFHKLMLLQEVGMVL